MVLVRGYWFEKGLAAVFETAQFLFELLDVQHFFHFSALTVISN